MPILIRDFVFYHLPAPAPTLQITFDWFESSYGIPNPSTSWYQRFFSGNRRDPLVVFSITALWPYSSIVCLGNFTSSIFISEWTTISVIIVVASHFWRVFLRSWITEPRSIPLFHPFVQLLPKQQHARRIKNSAQLISPRRGASPEKLEAPRDWSSNYVITRSTPVVNQTPPSSIFPWSNRGRMKGVK